jgi:hypothetical protein
MWLQTALPDVELHESAVHRLLSSQFTGWVTQLPLLTSHVCGLHASLLVHTTPVHFVQVTKKFIRVRYDKVLLGV